MRPNQKNMPKSFKLLGIILLPAGLTLLPYIQCMPTWSSQLVYTHCWEKFVQSRAQSNGLWLSLVKLPLPGSHDPMANILMATNGSHNLYHKRIHSIHKVHIHMFVSKSAEIVEKIGGGGY